MSNPLCQRLSGTASLAAIVVVVGFSPAPDTLLAQTASALSDPAAEYVQVNADIEVLQWGGSLGGEYGPRYFQIHAVVGRDKWVIGELFSGQTNYYSFNGTNIVEWGCSFGTNGSTGSPWTRSSKSSDGNPGETVRVSDSLEHGFSHCVARFLFLRYVEQSKSQTLPSLGFLEGIFGPIHFCRKSQPF